MNEYILQLSNSTIKILIERKKIKNYYLKILPDSSVTVSVPLFMDIDKICDFINTKKKWIEKTVNKFNAVKILSVKDNISDGGTVKILDAQRIIFIYESKENKITLDGFNLYIYSVKFRNSEYVEKQYNDYLKKSSTEYFESVMDKYYPVFAGYGVIKPKLKVKFMKSKWGSCMPASGRITLNVHLFKASAECVEYVIFHELTHLLYPDHKKNFYDFMKKHIPQYKVIEKRLDSEAVKLLY